MLYWLELFRKGLTLIKGNYQKTFKEGFVFEIVNAEKPKSKDEINAKLLNAIPLGRNDDDNVYDIDEIISDAFSYSITLNKLHIAFYFFKKYEDDVYGNKTV